MNLDSWAVKVEISKGKSVTFTVPCSLSIGDFITILCEHSGFTNISIK